MSGISFRATSAAKTAVTTLCLAAASLFTGQGTAVHAQTQAQNFAQARPFIVRNDRGGLLRNRLAELSQLRRSRQPVRITGSVCYSTCTMFLGLQTACISPNTTFGFHGPSSYGRALDPETFNRASAIIASHYPQELRTWYMTEGRFRIRGMYKVRGSEIVALGVPAC